MNHGDPGPRVQLFADDTQLSEAIGAEHENMSDFRPLSPAASNTTANAGNEEFYFSRDHLVTKKLVTEIPADDEDDGQPSQSDMFSSTIT